MLGVYDMEFNVNIDRNRKIITLRYGSMTTVEYDYCEETEIGEILQEFYDENIR